ncbi:hypothetical protein B0H21DRAFT_842014 [Amylocystis lapponica]|nr:hypothetical protein B0H21DRAFT_842014 [Amylocystis lapponica]
MPQGSPTSWSYFFVRCLFKFVLKIFYGTIVVENADLIPAKGQPCIVCANHSNSLTDALLLVTAIPSKTEHAKTHRQVYSVREEDVHQLAHRIRGTVPIKRPKDFGNGQVDNSEVMLKLMEALEEGDAVCLFPEGMSRYHPTIAPLKTGVARIVSDVLSRNREQPDFEISVLTCSITYMHRQHWRSDVLVTFHEPIKFRPKDNPELLAPIDYSNIRALTARLHQQISSGTLDAPSWRLIRNAKLAARMYAPLGTTMSLGDYVRVVRTFLEAFKLAEASRVESSSEGETMPSEQTIREDGKIIQLGNDLQKYQDLIASSGIKDDRVRKPLPRHVMVFRIVVRLSWTIFLVTISLPGLLLWLPVLITTVIAVSRFKRTGPIWDTWDEIAQYKLIYGLISGVCVWVTAILLSLPVAPLTAVVVPVGMWMSLRWTEDAVSAFRAVAALSRLLLIGRPRLDALLALRASLHARVMELAVQTLGLQADPEQYFAEIGGRQKGRVQGRWESKAKYFSVRRRRKRDWNETLRLYDQVDYPEVD